MKFSFSQWESYHTCPAQWNYRSIQKLPRLPPGPAASRGLDLHDRCEKFITGKITEYQCQYGDQRMRFGNKAPAVILPKYLPILYQFKDHGNGARYTEKEYAFDHEWYICAPKGVNTKVIAILDAVRHGGPWDGPNKDQDKGVVFIAEWKSGSPKETHVDQRKLYALVGLTAFLTEEVRVTTYYLESNEQPQRLTVKLSAQEKLQALWQDRFNQMERDKICAPRPGDYCKWCDFSKRVGGPCKVG